MGKYFITGNAGTGKTTTILALKERGLTAYDIDKLPDIHGYLDTQNNEVLDRLPVIKAHDAAGFTRYALFIKESGLRKLLATDGTIFLGGSTTMQEQFYPLFDKIFGLVVPREVHEERLASRSNNPTGNNEKDRAYLLSINDRIESRLKIMGGGIIINTNQPLDKVVDEILSHVDNK